MVIDCVGSRDEWKEAYRSGVLKSGWNGGRYISVSSDEDPQLHTVWQVIYEYCLVSVRSFWRWVGMGLYTNTA